MKHTVTESNIKAFISVLVGWVVLPPVVLVGPLTLMASLVLTGGDVVLMSEAGESINLWMRSDPARKILREEATLRIGGLLEGLVRSESPEAWGFCTESEVILFEVSTEGWREMELMDEVARETFLKTSLKLGGGVAMVRENDEWNDVNWIQQRNDLLRIRNDLLGVDSEIRKRKLYDYIFKS
jgi:hypothetical protein